MCIYSNMNKCVSIWARKNFPFILVLVLILTGLGLSPQLRAETGGAETIDREYIHGADQGQEITWPDQKLKQRLNTYWGLRFQGPYQATFDMEVPFFQYVVSQKKYIAYVQKLYQFKLDKIEIIQIKSKSKDVFQFVLRIVYQGLGGQTKETKRTDDWVEHEGQWYHVIDNRYLFPEAT